MIDGKLEVFLGGYGQLKFQYLKFLQEQKISAERDYVMEPTNGFTIYWVSIENQIDALIEDERMYQRQLTAEEKGVPRPVTLATPLVALS